MPPSVFRRLHRLRKIEERTAQVALVEARISASDAEAEVVALMDRIHASQAIQESHSDSAGLLAQCHRFALDGELLRREADARLRTARQDVARAHGAVVHHSTQARTVELLAEAHEDRLALEEREQERRSLDEVGAQLWLRRAS